MNKICGLRQISKCLVLLSVGSLLTIALGCNEPPDLFHAEKGNVEGGKPPYPIGSIAKYNCLGGYYKHEGTDIAECISDADGTLKWTRPTLDCRAVHCGDPGQVEHAERIGFVFTHPHNVTYVCHRGYRTEEKGVLYCLPGGEWSDTLPVCEVIRCPVPDDPADGHIRYDDTIYQSVAIYSCSKGFTLQGDRERHCTSNATWSGTQPICKEVRCELITSIPGGHIVHGATSDKPGDLVIMKCLYSDARKTLKCDDSGEWSAPPLVCPVPTPSTTTTTTTKPTSKSPSTGTTPHEGSKCGDPGDINHGSLVESLRDISFPTQANLTFQCKPGYKLKGHATLRCLPTGQWEPSILPACDKIVPMSLIIGLTIGSLFLLILAGVLLAFYLHKRKRKRKAEADVCLKRKANSIDAKDIEETCCLEKDKKPIPVTSL